MILILDWIVSLLHGEDNFKLIFCEKCLHILPSVFYMISWTNLEMYLHFISSVHSEIRELSSDLVNTACCLVLSALILSRLCSQMGATSCIWWYWISAILFVIKLHNVLGGILYTQMHIVKWLLEQIRDNMANEILRNTQTKQDGARQGETKAGNTRTRRCPLIVKIKLLSGNEVGLTGPRLSFITWCLYLTRSYLEVK